MGLRISTQIVRRAVRAAGFAVLGAVPLLLACGPAQAQFFGGAFGSRFSWAPPAYEDDLGGDPGYTRRGMQPRAVYRMLVEDGYRVMGPLTPRGRVYLADVADSETGQRERLVIDAYSGDIIEAYPQGRQFAPPGRVPRADAPDPRPAARRDARLAPPADAGDPLVLPGIGAKPHVIGPRPAVRARLPVKPKAVIARRNPVAPGGSAVPAVPVKPPLPSAAQPSNPLSLPGTPETAAPVVPAPDPAVAAVPPVAPLPPAAPAAVAAPAAAANDSPVQPLDDATPAGKPKKPVNDIPVAPLE